VQEWSDDPAALRAWQQGRTGFPLVDAGMRQLWQTGWMQQSIRMVCAAFLTEYLSMHWLHGCR
jgi:deoxyribodipyrimidine photo-lyase